MSFWDTISELRSEFHAYARSISDTAEDAEDLVGDAIERAARSDSRPDSAESLRPWMFRVIRNLNVDELRKRRVRREYSASAIRLYDETGPIGLGADEVILLRGAFAQLSQGEREILFLVDIAGMKYAEASAVMDVPVGTVMSRVSRARRSLLDRVEPAVKTNVTPIRPESKKSQV